MAADTTEPTGPAADFGLATGAAGVTGAAGFGTVTAAAGLDVAAETAGCDVTAEAADGGVAPTVAGDRWLRRDSRGDRLGHDGRGGPQPAWWPQRQAWTWTAVSGGLDGGRGGLDAAAGATDAAADVTADVTEPAVPVAAAAGWDTASAAAATGGTVSDGEVAAWACRENTSKIVVIPAARTATCTTRRAARRKAAWDTGSSRPVGRHD